jgi:hypothetical protein
MYLRIPPAARPINGSRISHMNVFALFIGAVD